MIKEIKKRRKRKKNYYFTEVHENAIVRYSNITDQKERTELYIAYIQPAFNEMVDKIAYTYKFTSLPNIDYLKDDCKIWLTTILDKFDPSKGSKAFSYFSVITKNWFIHKSVSTKMYTRKSTVFTWSLTTSILLIVRSMSSGEALSRRWILGIVKCSRRTSRKF